MIFEIEVSGRQMIKIDRSVFVLVEDLDGQIHERIRTFDYRGEEIGHTRRGSAAFDYLSRREKRDLLRQIREADAGLVPNVGEVMFKDVST